MGNCEICESGVNIDGDWVLRHFRESYCERYCEFLAVGEYVINLTIYF